MAYIGDKLDVFARNTPEDTALICGGTRLNWRNLVGKIVAAEGYLRRHSLRGGRIALVLEDPVALVVCFLACARIARIAMVIDPQWPVAQRSAAKAATKPGLQIDDAVYKSFSDIDIDQQEGSAPADCVEPNEEDSFYVGFTSGSTGVPKGYLRNHGSWLQSFALSDREFETPEGVRIVLAGQLVHSLHLYGAIYGLASGREVVLLRHFDPRILLAEIARSKQGASLYATPTQVHYLAEAAKRSASLDTLRQVLVSGAKWREEDRRALNRIFPGAGLFEFYGASETSFITVSGAEDNVPPGCVGRAAKGVDIAIGDPAAPAPDGVTGAIWVKSDLLFTGYVCGTSDETHWQDGWLTFGDHGFLDGEGYLFLTGRANRMVITSGLNVYPEEVEAVLSDHPTVELAVVTGVSDPVRGQVLEAIVKLSAPLAEAEMELSRHCKNHLATGKVPRHFHFREHMPLTPGGKPDIRKITTNLVRQERIEGA
jgi:acyl-CoA synthetase (AMP-forming)/AMP-acid ligase II